jgi:hypothetical protein
MTPKKWARVRRAGAHGLRRGAWYAVVNDSKPNVVFLDVNKRNVAMDRTLLEFADERPSRWSVVERGASEPAAQRASDANLDPTYGVCPACRNRANLAPGQTTQRCPGCGEEFGVDWEHPC